MYLLDMSQEFLAEDIIPTGFKTVNQLIEEGSNAGSVEAVKWAKDQATRQCAYLCFSSGTSGLPVRVPSNLCAISG